MLEAGAGARVAALAGAAAHSMTPIAPTTAASENNRCTTPSFVPAFQDCASETTAFSRQARTPVCQKADTEVCRYGYSSSARDSHRGGDRNRRIERRRV